MPDPVVYMMLLVATYLLGAVPFGLLIARARGIDIRQHGSRNIGATNVGRVLGKRYGHICLALDILKGLLPTLAYGLIFVPSEPDARALGGWVTLGGVAVLGHLFPIYLGFRGGKGVATTIGVGVGIVPYFTIPMIVALLAYAGLRKATGKVSVGSLALAIVFPLAVAAYLVIQGVSWSAGWPLIAVAALLTVLIVVRHTDNIKRLLAGEELAAPTTANAPDSTAPHQDAR